MNKDRKRHIKGETRKATLGEADSVISLLPHLFPHPHEAHRLNLFPYRLVLIYKLQCPKPHKAASVNAKLKEQNGQTHDIHADVI